MVRIFQARTLERRQRTLSKERVHTRNAPTCSLLFTYSPRGICTERSGSIPYLKNAFSLYQAVLNNHTSRFHFGNARPRITPAIRSIFWQMPEASRARFPSSGCFPRHAEHARRGDEVVARRGEGTLGCSPRRTPTQLLSNFLEKANFFRNVALPLP